MSDRRLQDLVRFYSILNQLEKTTGGARALADCRGRMTWPARGVYLFHEAGEDRSDTGEGPRVVPVWDRKIYMEALEKASIGEDIVPFTDFLAGLVKKGLAGEQLPAVPKE